MGLEGRLLGNRYEIIEQIGNGGMATVYKAKCHVLNRYVAVKVLRDEFTTDEEFIKRFNTEAQAVASLTHPNIVSVYDVGHEGNLYYIVMELIKGRTLKEIIVSEGALAWKWCVNVAIQIASALETAHKNNIIHRDIKPHNIIITEDGMAKVTDFGIAKAVSNSTITAFGTTMGSVHYFSPEHAKGGITDAKSDLYSLGVVMYEMLTGKLPFDADTPVSVALKHLQEQPIEPIIINPTIPQAVNKIIMKSMQKDSSLRYQNAGEMLKDLSIALKNPDADFVNIDNTIRDYPTQTISTIYSKPIEDKVKEKEKDMEKEKKNKFTAFIGKHKIISTIIGLVILFALTIAITSFAFDMTTPKDVLIPDLVGLTLEDAKTKIEESKLQIEVKEERYDAVIEAGKIISQDPIYKENYKIKEKSTINVIVSLGLKIVKVPKVTGKTLEEAKELLEKEDLVVVVEEEPSKKIEAGYVISQDVPENAEIGAGSTVTIKVSTGVEKSLVPNVLGKTEADARKLITDAGLTLATTLNAEDTTKDNGVVLKQSLNAGDTVEKGSNITITINKIEEFITGTINLNLKSLLGTSIEYVETEEEDTGETIKTAKVSEVKIVAGTDTIYSKKVAQDKTDITATVTGKGTVTVKVYVDDVIKKTTTINLNQTTTLTIE